MTLGCSYVNPVETQILVPSSDRALLQSSSWSKYGVSGDDLIWAAFSKLDHGPKCMSFVSSVASFMSDYKMCRRMKLSERHATIQTQGLIQATRFETSIYLS